MPRFVSHALRIALAFGAMVLICYLAGKILGWFGSIAGMRSPVAFFSQLFLIALVGIGGGVYISVRYITPNSVWHPVVAGVLLGLYPVGVTFSGDAAGMRFAIFLIVTAIATIAAFVFRSRRAPPDAPLERERGY